MLKHRNQPTTIVRRYQGHPIDANIPTARDVVLRVIPLIEGLRMSTIHLGAILRTMGMIVRHTLVSIKVHTMTAREVVGHVADETGPPRRHAVVAQAIVGIPSVVATPIGRLSTPQQEKQTQREKQPQQRPHQQSHERAEEEEALTEHGIQTSRIGLIHSLGHGLPIRPVNAHARASVERPKRIENAT